MTSDDFKVWRERLGLSQQQAAEALGISKGTVVNYESGSRRDDDRPVTVPKSIELACAALTFGIAPDFTVRTERGQFQIVEIEIKKQGAYGEVIAHERKVVPHPFVRRIDAEQMAERVAASHRGGYGYNAEHGYWWGRDLRGGQFRFVVEAV